MSCRVLWGEARMFAAGGDSAGEWLRARADGGSLCPVVASPTLTAAQARAAVVEGRLLGIDAIDGRWGPDHRAAVEAHAATSTADRDRALLAAAIAIGEENARRAPAIEAAKRHLDVLATYGFDTPADDPTTG